MKSTDSLKNEDFTETTDEESGIDLEESLFEKTFEETEKIKAGGFGVVYKCLHKLDNTFYAIKKVGFNSDTKKLCMNEAKIHSMLEHEHIVHLYHSWTQSGFEEIRNIEDESCNFDDTKTERYDHTLYIQMELCCRSLADLLETDIVLSTSESWKYFSEIANGMLYVHTKDIIHKDLGKGNILIGLDGKVKIADFGLARILDTPVFGKPCEGAIVYQSPEMANGEQINKSTDIWSMGVLFFFLNKYYRKSPMERSKNLSKVKNNYWTASILGHMLDLSPTTRPSITDICSISVEDGEHCCEELRSFIRDN